MPATNSERVPGDATAMRGPSAALIEVDEASFDPWCIQPVRHALVGHPLLQLPALIALGERLEARGSIRTHGNAAAAGTSFGDAPKTHPNTLSAAETLGAIQQANAWMSLLNVQVDPLYRVLVGQVLDDIRTRVGRSDPGMCYRAGWIFVSSPHTVTPFHFDKEHNFILQVSGKKRIYVWDHTDTVVASEQARDRFHHSHGRELLVWREDFRERARVFDLLPGEGAYMPSTSPHMVETHDEPSITISFTYYTDATRRDALLHKTHELLRRRGINPPPVGRMPSLDTLTHAGVATLLGARGTLRRIAGRPVETVGRRFAEVPA
ncbi:MAG: cupin-like domain-containing protein [Lysobacter sp.]